MNKISKRLASLEQFPDQLQTLIKSLVAQQNFSGYFSADQVKQLCQLGTNHQQLLRLLIPLAQTYSIAPLSEFYVGAAALSASGAIYLGANMELPPQNLGQTINAEQSAISHTWHHGESSITLLAVSTTPCGHCRQFMNELPQANQLEILLPDQQSIQLSQLLPHSFGPSDLAVADRLMKSAPYALNKSTSDPLLNAAINAAQQSYSPYSNSPSGIALKTKRAIYQGRYAENCAYNPSLSPLQSALIAVHLANDNFCDITEAVLVESKSRQISQLAISQNILSELGDIDLIHYAI